MREIKIDDFIKQSKKSANIGIYLLLILIIAVIALGVFCFQCQIIFSIAMFIFATLFVVVAIKLLIARKNISKNNLVVVLDELVDKSKKVYKFGGHKRQVEYLVNFAVTGTVNVLHKEYEQAVVGKKYYLIFVNSVDIPISIYCIDDYCLDSELSEVFEKTK